MHAESIKDVLHATPFQPFAVHTVRGAHLLIDHPELVLLTRGGRTLYINLPEGEGERVSVVDTVLIERLEPRSLV